MTNTLIHQGNLISVHKEQVNFPGGHQTYFDIVHHPGGSVIAAVNENNELCMLHQYRHALDKTIWELPAGCLETGEPPVETAKRELEEETGFIASEWSELGTIVPSPGFSNEVLYLFLAKNLSKGQLKLDAEEIIETHWFSMQDILKMVQNNEIEDAKTLALLMKLQGLID